MGMCRIGRESGDLARYDEPFAPRCARAAFMGMPAVHDDRGAVERILEEALIGLVADRIRHLAFGIGEHAVGGNDDIAFDAAHHAILEDRQVPQQRDYADNNHDYADDLLGAAVDRQQVDEVKHQNNDDKRDQDTDENVHEIAPRLNARNNARPADLVPRRAARRGIMPYIAGTVEAAMSNSPSLIMVQFLIWVADRPRTREQAVEAWHSCPHISVWEDAVVEGLVRTENDGRRTIVLTSRGRLLLEKAKAPAL